MPQRFQVRRYELERLQTIDGRRLASQLGVIGSVSAILSG